jgi:hypothetical protein
MGRKKLNLSSRVCVICGSEKDIKEFKRRKHCKKCESEKQKKYRKENLEKVRLIKKEWRIKNRDKENERTIRWKKNNKEKVKTTRNNYLKNKRKTDVLFKLTESMRRMLRRCLIQKTDRTFKILGYTPTELRVKIESLFTPGMSWENYGEWHIDHIKPMLFLQKILVG